PSVILRCRLTIGNSLPARCGACSCASSAPRTRSIQVSVVDGCCSSSASISPSYRSRHSRGYSLTSQPVCIEAPVVSFLCEPRVEESPQPRPNQTAHAAKNAQQHEEWQLVEQFVAVITCQHKDEG